MVGRLDYNSYYSDGVEVDSTVLTEKDDSNNGGVFDVDLDSVTLNISNDGYMSEDGSIVVMDKDDDRAFEMKYINIENIIVGRRIRTDKAVDDLIKSIANTGLLEPIVLAPTATEDQYVLLAGMRRLLACARLGMKFIPSIINNKVTTKEIPIVEAMYNHSKVYTMREKRQYIEYLETEKGILNPTLIEFLAQLNIGDYTKLKDILNDDDTEIVGPLMNDELTIALAFQKLEKRRKKESRQEQEEKKTSKVFGEEDSGAKEFENQGEVSENKVVLSIEEIKELGIVASDEDLRDVELSDLLKNAQNEYGFDPNIQKTGERTYIDPAIRRAVMAKYKDTCQCCYEGGPEYVLTNDYHHVVPVFLGGPDTEENGTCICCKCHRMVHLFARGDLTITDIESMEDAEKNKMKRIIAFGVHIRKAMKAQGMKRDQYKKLDNMKSIGRSMPGKLNDVG